MGHWFSVDEPGDGGDGPGLNLNGHQMSHVRLAMIEAGVIAGDGLRAALGLPGLEPTADTLPGATFTSNDGWHITAHEAAFIAARLRRASVLDVVGELGAFLDDGPDAAEWRGWIDEFVAFNEQAAARDGYYVT